MKTNLTELVFILDKSGSMSGLESDTIGGYNAMLKKQQAEPGEATITTVLFDDKYELLHDRINIKGVRPITEKEYFVEGSTALMDAIGKTIQKMVNVQKNTSEDQRADQVVFVITTDGMENASREYTSPKIKKMVEHQKAKYNWEFIFLGANIDAVATAADFGIDANRAANFHADSVGIEMSYSAVNDVVSNIRECKEISNEWKAKIDHDYLNREKTDKK